jgi:hypothetical protein
VAAADEGLAAYLAMRFGEIVRHLHFENTLPGLVVYDELYADRVRRVRERIASIAALSRSASPQFLVHQARYVHDGFCQRKTAHENRGTSVKGFPWSSNA